MVSVGGSQRLKAFQTDCACRAVEVRWAVIRREATVAPHLAEKTSFKNGMRSSSRRREVHFSLGPTGSESSGRGTC